MRITAKYARYVKNDSANTHNQDMILLDEIEKRFSTENGQLLCNSHKIKRCRVCFLLAKVVAASQKAPPLEIDHKLVGYGFLCLSFGLMILAFILLLNID